MEFVSLHMGVNVRLDHRFPGDAGLLRYSAVAVEPWGGRSSFAPAVRGSISGTLTLSNLRREKVISPNDSDHPYGSASG